MMRDPNGIDQLTEPKTKWNVKDHISWTKSYRKQVPFNIDPLDFDFFKRTGVFFVDEIDFKRCFSDFAQAINLNKYGYTNDWYDVDDEQTMWGSKMGPARNFTFLAPKQDLDSKNYIKNGPD